MWRVMTMDELWDYIPRTPEELKCIIKPKYPTNRWGMITTKTSTNDIKSINLLIEILKGKGLTVRKRKCLETMTRIKNRGIFYKIEVKNLDN